MFHEHISLGPPAETGSPSRPDAGFPRLWFQAYVHGLTFAGSSFNRTLPAAMAMDMVRRPVLAMAPKSPQDSDELNYPTNPISRLIIRGFSAVEDVVYVGLGVLLAFSAVSMLVTGGIALWRSIFGGAAFEGMRKRQSLDNAPRKRDAARAMEEKQ